MFHPAPKLECGSQGTDQALTGFRLGSDACFRRIPLEQGRETRAGAVLTFLRGLREPLRAHTWGSGYIQGMWRNEGRRTW